VDHVIPTAAIVEPTTRPKLGPSVAIYEYDGTSTPFEVHRFAPPGGDKTFRQCQVVEGERVWNLSGVELCLYRQPEVERAALEIPILIVEGERDVDELIARGYTATCNPMGAGKWRDSYNTVFTDRRVILIPDNDQPGRNHAEQVAAALAPVADGVKVLSIPDMPEHGDVSDFFANGGTAEQFRDLVATAEKWSEFSPVARDDAEPVELVTLLK